MNSDPTPYLHNPMYPAHRLSPTEISVLVRKQSRINHFAGLQAPSPREARLLRKLNAITGKQAYVAVTTTSIIHLP